VDDAEKAEEAVRRARERLVGTRLGSITVDSVFHYGAVDIDPRHLVVWVLLSGADDDALPEWLFIDSSGIEQSQAKRLDPQLVSRLVEVQSVVRQELDTAEWPSATHVRVGFDRSHRVETAGGLHYFK
jgi:hypothetical protein